MHGRETGQQKQAVHIQQWRVNQWDATSFWVVGLFLRAAACKLHCHCCCDLQGTRGPGMSTHSLIVIRVPVPLTRTHLFKLVENALARAIKQEQFHHAIRLGNLDLLHSKVYPDSLRVVHTFAWPSIRSVAVPNQERERNSKPVVQNRVSSSRRSLKIATTRYFALLAKRYFFAACRTRWGGCDPTPPMVSHTT